MVESWSEDIDSCGGSSSSLDLISSKTRLLGDVWLGGSGSVAGGGAGDELSTVGRSRSGGSAGSGAGGGGGGGDAGCSSDSAVDSVGVAGSISGVGGGDGLAVFRESSSVFFCGLLESGVPGEQRSMVSDLSSESLELTTMPESLLLPQSRVSGFSAGGDLLSMIRGEATGWGVMDGGG